MVNWLTLCRETSLTVATITAIIAHAMGSLTINLSAGGVFTENILYAHLAVAGGVLTILSLPMILLFDMAQEKSYSATVIFELLWSLVLTVVWIIAGIKTTGITSGTFKNCASITNATVQGLCTDAETLVLFAFLSAGIMGLYAVILGIVAAGRASSGDPIWTYYPMPSEKKH